MKSSPPSALSDQDLRRLAVDGNGLVLADEQGETLKSRFVVEGIARSTLCPRGRGCWAMVAVSGAIARQTARAIRVVAVPCRFYAWSWTSPVCYLWLVSCWTEQ